MPAIRTPTLVTNHQYVDFLNKNLSKIRVENGVVQSEGEIWLFLGEVTKGYEPILFRDGKFQIAHAPHASCPVLRVTAYGASAYADFYGKRLLTSAEWFHAVQEGGGGLRADGASQNDGRSRNGESTEEMVMDDDDPTRDQTHVHAEAGSSIPSPVINSPKDALGIRGLNGSIREWGIRIPADISAEERMEYMVLGRLASSFAKGEINFSAVTRHPWEAFGRVGFRCVLSVKDTDKQLSNGREG
jgi:eukaryotic-like serine/threonine-protein kinase